MNVESNKKREGKRNKHGSLRQLTHQKSHEGSKIIMVKGASTSDPTRTAAPIFQAISRSLVLG